MDNFCLQALDALALELANHRHHWSNEERWFYENAVDSLTSFSGYKETDLSALTTARSPMPCREHQPQSGQV